MTELLVTGITYNPRMQTTLQPFLMKSPGFISFPAFAILTAQSFTASLLSAWGKS